jgi:hypothetical protein
MVAVPDMQVDWFQILLDVQRKGYKLVNVSAVIDVPRTTMLGWRDLEASPRHADGERLIALWCQVTGQQRESLPKMRKWP